MGEFVGVLELLRTNKDFRVGTRYVLKMTRLEELLAQSDNTITHCQCFENDPEKTGQPKDFVVSQADGFVTFDFKDNSRCEKK